MIEYNFAIEDDGVRVVNSDIFSSRQYKVPFYNMELLPNEYTNYAVVWIFITGFVSLCTIVVFLNVIYEGLNPIHIFTSSAVAIISYLMYLYKKGTIILFYASPDSLVLLKDDKNESELNNFISELTKAHKIFFMQIIPNSTNYSAIDEIERLAHLKNVGALSEEEFETLKKIVIDEVKIRKNFFGDSSIN